MENRRAANLLFFPRSASYVFTSSPATLERNKLNDQILNAIDEEIAKLRQARAILTAVSYTHLDVYKRQTMRLANPSAAR